MGACDLPVRVTDRIRRRRRQRFNEEAPSQQDHDPPAEQYALPNNHLTTASETLHANARASTLRSDNDLTWLISPTFVGGGWGEEGVANDFQLYIGSQHYDGLQHYSSPGNIIDPGSFDPHYRESGDTRAQNLSFQSFLYGPGDRRNKIRQWLSPTIPSTSYDEALELRLQDTGMWFMGDKRFSDWKENADLILWLYGNPGSGQSVVSSFIIEDISHLCAVSPVMAYGYFFFNAQKGLHRLEHLVISLIWQFSGRSETFPKALYDLYDSCSSGAQRPSMESLHKTLLLLLDNFHYAYLIVDSLDECTERNKVLKWIDEIARCKVGKLHLLVTSRQELPDIQKALQSLDPILVCLEGNFVEHDIISYLDWMLRVNRKQKAWDHDPRYKIMTSLLQGAQGMYQDNLADIGNALSALTWIVEKYQSASAPLPETVANFKESMIGYLKSRKPLAASQDTSSEDASEEVTAKHPPPRIGSVFLVESPHNADVGVGEPSQKSILVTDFIERQFNVPLELCKSWPILCEFLNILLRGEKGSSFITTQKFGLLVPGQVHLLHEETWNSWVTRIKQRVGIFPIAVELYAIIDDDGNSCPRCKRLVPATRPLPLGQHVQQCLHCDFTFLELYQEVGLCAELAGPPPLHPIPDDILSQANTDIHEPDHLLTQNLAIAEREPLYPKHVQVVRRRRRLSPFLSADQYPPTAHPNRHQTLPPGGFQTCLRHWDVLRTLYMHTLFCLPDRCRRDAPFIPPRIPFFRGPADPQYVESVDNLNEFYRNWQTFCDRVMGEWVRAGSAASVLFGTLFTVLQISSAANDPITRTVVQLSIVCLFFGVIYSCILWMTFRRLEPKHKGLAWMREATETPRNFFWNLWVMLSMPLAWILWGVIYFTIFLVFFLWRSGASDGSDKQSGLAPQQAYGPRAVTTLVFVAGVVYLVLIFFTVRNI